MKVLLLSPKEAPSYTEALYVALRSQVGTCDYFPLEPRQSSNLPEFFHRHIRLEHFDRIILMFPPAFIYQHSPFLRHLPTLAVLALEQRRQSRDQLKKSLSNLKTMPWLRWIGSNAELCRAYQGEGYDAYWVPPAFDNRYFNNRQGQWAQSHCHIYGPPPVHSYFRTALASRGLPLHFYNSEQNPDLSGRLMGEDIFIYWGEDGNDVEPLIKALACGTVVICRPVAMEERVLYDWRAEENIVFAEDLANATDRVLLALNNPLFRQELARNGAEKAKVFLPSAVGKRIGRYVEIAVRNPRNYPMRQRIFGFDI